MAESRTFRRYVYRIFIPAAVVVLIAIVLRFVMAREFHEENVRPADSGSGVYPHRGDTVGTSRFLAYSEDTKRKVVEDLRASLDQLVKAGEDDGAVDEDADGAMRRQVEESIDAVSAADSENWRSRLSTAYQLLSDYARARGRDGSDEARLE